MFDKSRIVFLDYLRTIAIFMVLVVHACEQFYFNADGDFFLASLTDARWAVGIDSAVRACVPLFVMASAYLLFPITRPTGEFLRRRLLRVLVPYGLWCCVYTALNGGEWSRMLFNFPLTVGGHLWFVPMLLGLYLLMPLLSPWAERATEREVRGWLILWAFTTAMPYLRLAWGALFGCGWSHAFGLADFGQIPFLFGECGWNSFGTFHYVSGFFGYMLLGFYARRFLPELSGRRTLALALPLIALGWFAVAAPFFVRILPSGATFPFTAPYARAVELEVSWEFCSTGVAATVCGYFLIIRKFTRAGGFHALVIRPLATASYGVYLVHMLLLPIVVTALRTRLATPAAILLGAAATFGFASLFSLAVRRIPRIGPWLIG